MINHNIFKLMMVAFVLTFATKAIGQINVFAGDDTSICPGEVLIMSDLNAEISGEVDNGTWFTLGDGYFDPGNGNNVLYEDAESYIPGPGDIKNGWFTLLLASNYGMEGQETDMVNISFQLAPTLACNSSINISLSNNCQQEVTPELVLANPSKPYNRYNLNLYDKNNVLITDNILREEHIGQVITVGVTHDCDPENSCWSEIRVEDKNPPDLICANDTIDCTSSISPEVLGFPVSEGVVLERLEGNKWKAYGLDACTDAELWFTDEVMDMSCASPFEKIIFRNWKSKDENNNLLSCIEEIYIEKDSIQNVSVPPNYDNIDKEAIECGSPYPKLPNGHPSPDYTGYPGLLNCANLQATFEDLTFEICGGGIKILREWLMIDWCTAESRTHNQIIKILDTKAPEFLCPPDLEVETTEYDCISRSFLIDEDLNISDCSETTFSWKIFDSVGYQLADGTDNFIAELPLGIHSIEYQVSDICGNSSTCRSRISIVDRIVPTAVCDEFTSISLGIDGTARLYAQSLDDGSHDNCSITLMEVAKMTDQCDFGLEFGPYTDFCCLESNDTIMVAFKVTDGHQNMNTCMVTVFVEEKLPPHIECPSDLTVSCRYGIDFDNLSEFGKVVTDESEREDILLFDAYNNGSAGIDGLALDNCGLEIVESYIDSLECGQGLLIRTFTAVDDGGIKSSCDQEITIQDEDPFDYNDIHWPELYQDSVCVDTAISPDISGRPEFSNTHCASVASTYKDKVFPFAEGSCMKVIREWTVIDWCQFDERSGDGIWNSTQILKFENFEPPMLSFECRDSIVCLFDENCLSTRYFLDIQALDDCTGSKELYYFWSVDIYDNGTLDSTSNKNEIDIEVPVGTHHIYIEVEDRCGNISKCDFSIEVVDCKAPTPYCISEITTVLMDQSNEIEIWAQDFDFNSTDNCTPREELIFSFDRDTSIRSRILTCDDIPNGISGNVTLEMWVTDLSGNQEYCQVTVHVQDNNNNCEDQELNVMISGKVSTFKGVPVENVEINLHTSNPEYSSVYSTNDMGNYAFDNIPGHLEMEIIPQKTDDVDFGVSTLDIVLIQRHILGFKELPSIDKMIAADVNGSGSISGTDLVVIRKLILGVYDRFPNNVPSWKFSDAATMPDEENMHTLPSSVYFKSLNDDQFGIDFNGIKVGDVDDSVSRLRDQENSTFRLEGSISLQPLIVNNNIESRADFSVKNNIEMQGFQMALAIPESIEIIDVRSELEGFDHGNFHLIENSLLISWSAEEDVSLSGGDILFTIVLDRNTGKSAEIGVMDNHSLKSEYYRDFTAFPLKLDPASKELIDNADVSWNVVPRSNPFIDHMSFSIISEETHQLNYSIMDVSGRNIYTGTIHIGVGENELNLDGNIFPAGGIYIIRFGTENSIQSIKLLKLN